MNGKDAGFTLIELLVTLAILAIALSLGAPALSSLVRHARVSNTYHLLTTSLAAARLAAVKNGTSVTMCPSSDGITCRNDEIWETGWLLYIDPGRADQPADAKAILQSIDRRSGHLALRSTPGRTRIRFSPDGWSYGSNLSIRLCASDGRFLGQIVVNNAGRPRTEHYTVPRPCPFRS